MSYSVAKVTAYYPEFLKSFYAENIGLSERSYEQQHSALMRARFGWSDFYSTSFREIGVQASEIVSNAEVMQKAWLKENATGDNTRFNELETVLLQLQKLAPEVLFVEDCYRFGADWIKRAREKVHSIRLVIAYHCAPLTTKSLEALQECDLSFSCHPGFLNELLGKGFKAFRLNHAFSPKVLEDLNSANPFKFEEFLFIGSVLLSDDYHVMRWKVLEALLKSGIDLRIYGNFVDEPIRRKPWKIFSQRKISSALRAKASRPVFGLKMFQALSKGKIAFNNHIDASGPYAANMRLFEATGVGSCLLTDHKENIRDYFIPDEEVITYRSPEECVEKVKWLLANPKKREEIAKAGQRKTLTQHTYAQRVVQLDAILKKHL